MAPQPRLSLGGRLRREREQRHWAQKYVARQIGVTPLSVTRWENGQTIPHARTLQALAELFGKPIDLLGVDRPRVWVMPYLRNLYFTGRERALKRLHDYLTGSALNERGVAPVALSQTRAINGLGGIGKTQTAVEYAYRFGHEYDLVLWVHADARDTLIAQFAGLAQRLGLPNASGTDTWQQAKAVKRWLEEQQEKWLLIFDNVDDIQVMKEFLPRGGRGAVLLTTRLQSVGKHIHKLHLNKLSFDHGVQFLLARTSGAVKRTRALLSSVERQAVEDLLTQIDGLPLALDHAAAYIEENQCSLSTYVELFRQQRPHMLQLRNEVDVEDYPYSVATTWLVSFQRIREKHAAAIELLRLCAFLAPDDIPEEILNGAVETFRSVFASGAANDSAASEPHRAIKILCAYSLAQWLPHEHALSLHRLVQAVAQDELIEADRRLWARRALFAVNAVFPHVEPATWSLCERLLTQALFVIHQSEKYELDDEETGRLLYETASYLQFRAQNTEVEAFYRRAIRIFEEHLGAEHPKVAYALNNLGAFYHYHSKVADAAECCERALHILESHFGKDHVEVVGPLNDLAIIYCDMSKIDLAEALYERALAICTQRLGPSHHDTVRIMNNLGNLYCERGRYEKSEALLVEAKKIWSQQFGSEHSRVAYPLSGLGHLYERQGLSAKAKYYYQRALRIWEHELGPDYPEVANMLGDLARIHTLLGDHATAEQLLVRALGIWERQVSPEHPKIAATLEALATLREAHKVHSASK